MENLKGKPWHRLPAEEVVQIRGVNLSTGLSAGEGRRRQRKFCRNRLTAQQHVPSEELVPSDVVLLQIVDNLRHTVFGS
jgi:hypothetical protein